MGPRCLHATSYPSAARIVQPSLCCWSRMGMGRGWDYLRETLGFAGREMEQANTWKENAGPTHAFGCCTAPVSSRCECVRLVFLL